MEKLAGENGRNEGENGKDWGDKRISDFWGGKIAIRPGADYPR